MKDSSECKELYLYTLMYHNYNMVHCLHVEHYRWSGCLCGDIFMQFSVAMQKYIYVLIIADLLLMCRACHALHLF